jgi:hypothetical protein
MQKCPRVPTIRTPTDEFIKLEQKLILHDKILIDDRLDKAKKSVLVASKISLDSHGSEFIPESSQSSDDEDNAEMERIRMAEWGKAYVI